MAVSAEQEVVVQDRPVVVWSWALYDWANSAFTTLVVTFIYSTWFTKAMAPDELTGTGWWSRAVATSAILTGLLSPILGAAADRAGAQKRLLLLTTLTCVFATAALAFVPPGLAWAPLLALALVVIADFNFETGYTFYNAFLPAISSPGRIGRVSGYGWGLGYAGGLLCMVLALIGFVQPEVPWFGLSKEGDFHIRATNLLVAVWFLVFSAPLFLNVPEQSKGPLRIDPVGTLREVLHTIGAVRRYPDVARFLLARLVFNDGLVTIFAFGGIYAQGTFGMTLSEVITFGIALNLAAGLGALVFGHLDDRLGGRATLIVTLVALAVSTVVAVLAPTRLWLWVAGIAIGVFAGPNQSASRSLMGRFVPRAHQAEFFGFFQLSGKATSFVGPLLLGGATELFGSQRAGVASVLLFFVVGLLVLLTVNEERGAKTAAAAP